MKTITFDLPLFNQLNHGPLRLRQRVVPIELELKAGEHVFTSPLTEVGTFFHRKVFAHISIPYSYDPDLQYVTIGGPDDIKGKQLTIHTSIEQHAEFMNTHSLNNNVNEGSNMWTNFVNTTAVVKQAFEMAIRHAIDGLVVRLLDAGVQGVIQTDAAPIVNPGNYQEYKNMFAPKKSDANQPSLDDIIEVQGIIESTYYGTITWPLNYSFANIIGSTNDPKPSGYTTWISLWADKCNGGYRTDTCSSFNYEDGHTPFDCNTVGFVGGHVIPGTVAKKVAKGGTAYIFPICPRHNGNDNIYMSSRYNPEGVVLHDYME